MTDEPALPLLSLPGPTVSPESAPYWDGLRSRQIRVPRCSQCTRHHFPPLSVCPHCGSARLEWVRLESRPRVYSWIEVHRAPSPEIPVPYVVVLAEFAEGVRIPGNLVKSPSSELRVGAPLDVAMAGGDDLRIPVYSIANDGQ